MRDLTELAQRVAPVGKEVQSAALAAPIARRANCTTRQRQQQRRSGAGVPPALLDLRSEVCTALTDQLSGFSAVAKHAS